MNGVHRFVLDDSIGEFVYMGPMFFPEKSKTIYSCNEGNYQVGVGVPRWLRSATEPEKTRSPVQGGIPRPRPNGPGPVGAAVGREDPGRGGAL